MSHHTVHAYDRDLHLLTKAIVNMGFLVRDILRIAHESLQFSGRNEALRHEEELRFLQLARATDQKINAFDRGIEQRAISILALRQPMAVDLRLAISALKVGVIMERMGDLAKNVTKRMTNITFAIPSDILIQVHQMAVTIIDMLEQALLSFEHMDAELALHVLKKDETVDQLYQDLITHIERCMHEQSDEIRSYVQLIFALKNLERVGDYVTKLARIVRYICGTDRLTSDDDPKLAWDLLSDT